MIGKQFTLYLENRPGVLANVTRLLAQAKINLEGISASAGSDVALVQIVVSHAAKTKTVLNRASIAFTVQDVALLPLCNRPGALARVVGALAKAGVNINYIYATTCAGGRNCDSNVVISAPDLRLVEREWTHAVSRC